MPIYLQLNEMGLMKLYDADPEIRKIVGRVLCLPMMPNDRIIEAFDRIKILAMESRPILRRYFKYVRRNWIFCAGHFDIPDWGCYRRVRSNLLKCNITQIKKCNFYR